MKGMVKCGVRHGSEGLSSFLELQLSSLCSEVLPYPQFIVKSPNFSCNFFSVLLSDSFIHLDFLCVIYKIRVHFTFLIHKYDCHGFSILFYQFSISV